MHPRQFPSKFEGEATEPPQATIAVLRRAFELTGVEFIDENGGGPGLRLRKGHRKKVRA